MSVAKQVAPFGGVKQSGLGREGSKYGMDEYLEVKITFNASQEKVKPIFSPPLPLSPMFKNTNWVF